MRKTKILATLGPASSSAEIIERLMLAGMNGIRINFSHGTHESHGELIKTIKQVREKLGLPIPLLLDTRGPEIRTKSFDEKTGNKIQLEKGDSFTLTTKDIAGDKSRVSVTHAGFADDLTAGDRILLDDGLIELETLSIEGSEIHCIVKNGGVLGTNKGINAPDVHINLPCLTQKDKDDIIFGIKAGFDYIAASFVRSANDVFEIKHLLEENNGQNIEIIAKIESRSGVKNINEILEISSGIMVARGDLGVEIPPEEVPIVQKQLILKANSKGKPVITATQMLESMITNPRPTRAEASDVANAVFDGTDTLMLSGETAAGAYPIEAVEMMAQIAKTAETAVDYAKVLHKQRELSHKTLTNAISHSACTMANDLGASCISTVTKTGFTARMLSKFRPVCPIVACTSDEMVLRKLNLVWGCIPSFHSKTPTADKVFALAVDAAVASDVAKNGDTVIICAGLPIGGTGSTNTVRAELVGDILVKGRGIGEASVSANACVVKAVAEAEKYFKKGDVLVLPATTHDWMPYIKRASAIVVGNPETTDYNHAETAGRALDIPVIICGERVVDMIPQGLIITVEPDSGFVLKGSQNKK